MIQTNLQMFASGYFSHSQIIIENHSHFVSLQALILSPGYNK